VTRSRNASALTEIAKHLAIAGIVVAVSRATGTFITTYVHQVFHFGFSSGLFRRTSVSVQPFSSIF
jgi:hypothetical protein